MPNYRQKNKKKNNKKNNKSYQHNKNQNQNQNSTNQNKSNQNQQGAHEKQLEQQQRQTTKAIESEEKKLAYDQKVGNVSNEPTELASNSALQSAELKDDGTDKRSNEVADQCNDDTVSNENELEVTAIKQTEDMGSKSSKQTTVESVQPTISTDREDEFIGNEAKAQQVKLIIHRIVPATEIENSSRTEKTAVIATAHVTEIEPQPKVIIHSIAVEQEPDDEECEETAHFTESAEYEVLSPSSNDESFELQNETNENQLQIQEVLNEDWQVLEHTTSGLTKIDDVRLKRAQKRAAIETHFLPQFLSPRYLDSISEENSDLSDSVERPKVVRSLSAPCSEVEKTKRANAKFPRSQLDFSKPHKHGSLPNTLPTMPGPISEEPVALMVEAKLIELYPNEAQESCSTLSFKHLELKSEAAEVIFINSSTSSSSSDLNELVEEEEKPAFTRETVDLDTDVKEIFNKPVNKTQTDRESTPVNQTIVTPNNTEIINEPILLEQTIAMSEKSTAAEADQLSSDEQYSECSSNTLIDTSISSFSGHEANTSQLQTTADCKSSTTATSDISSVLSTTSFSDSSIVDASVEDSSSAEAFARLENTCREIMDNVREIVYANSEVKQPYNVKSNGISSLVSLVDDEAPYVPVRNGKHKSPTPPPIPPPPFSCDESSYIHVINNEQKPSVPNKTHTTTVKFGNDKCLERQESTESHCSSSTNHSQCTAINMASPLLSDSESKANSIQKLRLLCTQKLASLPYGEDVLEELATVAQNIGDMPNKDKYMPEKNLKELQMSLPNTKCDSVTLKPHEIVHNVLIRDDQLLSQKSEREISDKCERSLVELRKSLTPSPPPLPPPPVPTKSSETAAKAQQTNIRVVPIAYEQNDASIRNVNTKEQKTNFMPLNEYNQQQNNRNNANEISTKTSSVENSSRQPVCQFATGKKLSENYEQQKFSTEEEKKEHTSSTFSNLPLTAEQERTIGDMQSVESELGRMFPTLGTSNIFDNSHKRFSNIESSSSKTFPTLTPKRYSNIETISYEKGKRIENGQVIYDFEDKRQENCQEGDEVDANAKKSDTKLHNINFNNGHSVQLHDKMAENMRSTIKMDEQLSTLKNMVESKSEHHTTEEIRQASKPRIDQDKLFKDIDDLSQQLHHELETGRKEREQREKSASLFDLNRLHMKSQLDELKKKRHEHMLELEREIDRSMKSRQAKREVSYDHTQQQQGLKSYEIPIQIEEAKSQLRDQHKMHEIPIQLERGYDGHGNKTNPAFQHDSNSPFRRAESMYNLQSSSQSQSDPFSRPRTSSSTYETQQNLLSDDWSQYASDLGSSENITRPFAREMQICYQRSQPSAPRTIRAPRLTVSTHDLSTKPIYDHYNAYNVPRSPSTSCYSVLERDPNPTYISTTSRRGVSPAPQQPIPKPIVQSRRASLPREIHEQQLKYLSSKEDELRTEFERLQNERRRLLEELQSEKVEQHEEVRHRTTEPQVPPRARENMHRGVPRLPTLSEDEVFRQQMAEEWMSKVAEREERRLQKIIKISKIQEENGIHKFSEEQQTNSSTHLPHKPDLSQEFLNRVKERRHKLHMPADSDWESGAESQPININQNPDEVNESNIKVISGKSVKDVHELPQHLKEFARFSNQEREALENGGHRQVYQEEERRHETTPYTSSSAAKKSSIMTTMKISRQPPQTLASRPDTTTTLDSETVPDTAVNLHDKHFTQKLPDVFEQMFASSPFRERIYEEYERFWHNFNHQNFFD